MKLGRQGNLVIHRMVEDGKPAGHIVWFWCDGCGDPHAFEVPRWTFDGDYDRPTFEPSLLLRSTQGEDMTPHVCHLFLRDGQLQYLGDCTHKLAGKTVSLPEPPDWIE